MEEEKNRKVFCLNDEFVAQLQNLVSLSLLLGERIHDHVRQMRFEESKEKPGTLVLTKEYFEYFEVLKEKMTKEAEQREALQELQEAADSSTVKH